MEKKKEKVKRKSKQASKKKLKQTGYGFCLPGECSFVQIILTVYLLFSCHQFG